MRNVKTIDQRSSILGHEIQSPLFVSPAAMAKLVHPEGEKALARACEIEGIMQMVCTISIFCHIRSYAFQQLTIFDTCPPPPAMHLHRMSKKPPS